MSAAVSLRGQFSQGGAGGAGAFASPFDDYASLMMPQNIRSALYFFEYIFASFGTYRKACERKISYFLTDVEFPNADDEERDKWESCLNDTFGIKTVLRTALRNRECYGNNFTSVVVPFRRFLRCPKCRANSWALKTVHDNAAFAFSFNLPEFHAKCPTCKVGTGYSGKWLVEDMEDDDETKMRVKVWNPHEMEILHDPFTDNCAYLWRIPEDYKRLLRQGNLFHLERVPKEVLTAVHKNQLYRFHPEAIHHMKEPTLAGHYLRGWGLPPTMYNFRQIFLVQVIRRQVEAFGLDYLVPIRLVTPAPTQNKTGGGMGIDPISMYNGGDFRRQVMRMFRRRRLDPASMHVLPFPVNYQMFGADANQLLPREMLDQATQTLLNDSGVPIELYNGSLQLQAAPVALRLYEADNAHLVYDANDLLGWLVRQVSRIKSWEAIDCQMKRVEIADDFERQMAGLQLAMSQQISATSAVGAMGYRWKQEQKQIAEEARFQAEMQARTQQQMDTEGLAQQLGKGQAGGQQGGAQGGAQGGGGAGGGGGQGGDPSMQPPPGPVSQYLSSMGPDTPVTPTDLTQAATSMAQELLGQPESAKRSELRRLKSYNEVLYSTVVQKMDQIRRDTKAKAGGQAMQQGQYATQPQ